MSDEKELSREEQVEDQIVNLIVANKLFDNWHLITSLVIEDSCNTHKKFPEGLDLIVRIAVVVTHLETLRRMTEHQSPTLNTRQFNILFKHATNIINDMLDTMEEESLKDKVNLWAKETK